MLKSTKLRVNTARKNQNLIDLLTKTPKNSNKESRVKANIDLDQTTSSNHLLPPSKLKASPLVSLYPIIQQSLIEKYNTSPYEYSLIELENIIQSKYTRVLAVFKETLMFNYREEFLKRFYKKSESRPRILKCVDYYSNYLTFFCKPIFAEFDFNDIIQYHGEKKAKIYYSNNLKEKANERHNHQHHHNVNNCNEGNNGNTLFTTTLKGNISMNSCMSITQSIHQIDYNIIDTKPLIQNPSNFVNKSTLNTMNDIINELSPQPKPQAGLNNNAIPMTKGIVKGSHYSNRIQVSKEPLKPQKKMFLINKNQIISRDKAITIKDKTTLSITRLISPKSTNKAKATCTQYNVCSTESNRKASRNNPSSLNKDKELLYTYNKTESNPKRPFIANQNTQGTHLINKVKLQGNYNTAHCKNSYSTQMTLSVRGLKPKSIKESTNHSNGKKPKFSSKGLTKDSKEKPSRNVKCNLDKGYFTIETDIKRSVISQREEEIKLPLFKTINVKRKEEHFTKKNTNWISNRKSNRKF